jgi:hypothetical protein
VVSSDGPITELRREVLTKIATNGGFDVSHLAFVTALQDRDAAYRKASSEIAWNSFVWFASEPTNLIAHISPTSQRFLVDMLANGGI